MVIEAIERHADESGLAYTTCSSVGVDLNRHRRPRWELPKLRATTGLLSHVRLANRTGFHKVVTPCMISTGTTNLFFRE